MTCEICGHVSPAPDRKVIYLHDCAGRINRMFWGLVLMILAVDRQDRIKEFESRRTA